jgi:hypothetical protein
MTPNYSYLVIYEMKMQIEPEQGTEAGATKGNHFQVGVLDSMRMR